MMEQFVEYAPEYGEDPREYQEMREQEEETNPPFSLQRTKAKVKLLTTSLKWICTAKPKVRTLESMRIRQYFTQCLFTVRGNRVILTYDQGTTPMPAGSGKGAIVEIFGRSIDREVNPDKTSTAFISGAEILRTKRRDATASTTPKPQPEPPAKPKPDAAARMRARVAVELRKELMNLKRELEWDDTREEELKDRIIGLTIRLARVERGEELERNNPSGAVVYAGEERRSEPRVIIARDGEEAELRALVIEQLEHDTDTVGEVIDKDASDADSDAETIDHDDDGAEIERSTEPWADSSAPIGATIDADCWDCPARLGATCTRATCLLE